MRQAFMKFAAIAFAAFAQMAFAYDASLPVSDTNPAPSSMFVSDGQAMDPSGKFRVSNPHGTFEDSREYTIGSNIWDDVASGVGATSTINQNEGTVSLTIGTGASDYLYRQTRPIPYVPGKGQSIRMTFNMGAAVTNVTKRIGYFNDENGLFFQQAGDGTLSMCIRSFATGSAVDTCTAQANWNLDHFNGAGISKINLDITKAQLFVVDFLWQGVGRVRFGFQIDGKTYYVHQVLNANNQTVPYMGTASLPLRYEIRNTGVSVGASMKQICVSVESEGGYELPGMEYAASNGITTVAVTTRVPVIAIRMAATVNGKTNRMLAKILHSSYRAVTNDAFCELVHVHNPTATAGGTWVAVNADSAVEVNTGITSITATTQHVIDTNFVSAGLGAASASYSAALDWVNLHSYIARNATSSASQMFAVYCTSFAGTSNVSVELNWIEIK